MNAGSMSPALSDAGRFRTSDPAVMGCDRGSAPDGPSVESAAGGG